MTPMRVGLLPHSGREIALDLARDVPRRGCASGAPTFAWPNPTPT